jgi:hypothetical protein
MTKFNQLPCRFKKQYLIYLDRAITPDRKRRYFIGWTGNTLSWTLRRRKATLSTWIEAYASLRDIIALRQFIDFDLRAGLSLTDCLHVSSVKHHE